MKTDRARSIVAVHLWPIKAGKILLSRRYNTGYEDGKYSNIGGHVEKDESVTAAMIRESKEEAGVDILKADLKLAHIMHRNEGDNRIDFFFQVDNWQGEFSNEEPDKCDELAWYDLNALPINTVPYVRQAIEQYQQHNIYSEFRW
jgi:8-oxo-dGTP pyrophosphatase MutT (NUDIX family)